MENDPEKNCTNQGEVSDIVNIGTDLLRKYSDFFNIQTEWTQPNQSNISRFIFHTFSKRTKGFEFEPRHIARTIIKEGNPLWLDIGEKMVLVSKTCFEDGKIIRWMYREIGDREEDSGWRIFAGDEDDNYNNDSRNIEILNVYHLLDRDPSLLEPLKSKVGSAFERENMKTPWVKITDWNTEND